MANYNSWHTGVEIDTAVDEVPNKIDSINGNNIDKDIYINELNCVDTSNPIYDMKNCEEYQGVLALYYLQDIDTYFKIRLVQPLLSDNTYILSFNATGVLNGQAPQFNCIKTDDGVIVDRISQQFVIQNGINKIILTPSINISDSITLDDVGARFLNQNIKLSNFQIQSGNVSTTYQPSVPSIDKQLSDMPILSYREDYQGWDVGVIKDSFVSTSLTLDVNTAADSSVTIPNNRVSSEKYRIIPQPLSRAMISGSCTKDGYFLTGITKRTANGGVTGFGYRLQDTNGTATGNLHSSLDIIIDGRRTNPPTQPTSVFNNEYATQIVNIAQSYVNAQQNGRQFKYGKNIFYSNSNIVNYRGDLWVKNKAYSVGNIVYYVDSYDNIISYSCRVAHTSPDTSTPPTSYWTTNWNIVEHSPAMVECDTYVGLVLRGIEYQNSPFAVSDSPSFKYTYNELMTDTTYESSYPWCVNIRNNIQHPIYIGRDVKYAAENAWMFWGLDGQLFSDISFARKGDIAFWRNYDKKVFDNVSHCAILDFDENNVPYIYEVTGNNESGGKVLHKIALDKKMHKPDYFARVY